MSNASLELHNKYKPTLAPRILFTLIYETMIFLRELYNRTIDSLSASIKKNLKSKVAVKIFPTGAYK